MKLYLRVTLIYLFIGIAAFATAISQQQAAESFAFEFDAIVFRSLEDSTKSRVDAYILIPYTSLNFVHSGNIYGAKYEYTIVVFDSAGNKIDSKYEEKVVTEYDYFVAQGGTAKFDYLKHSFNLPKGSYKIKAEITDKYSNVNYQRQRTVLALNFSEYKIALSGIMTLSSIEENNGKYSITPHLTDNIGNLSEGFFLFFEIYNKNSKKDSIDLVYQILNADGSVLVQGKKHRKAVPEVLKRDFINVEKISSLGIGAYNLRLLAMEPTDDDVVNDSLFLAVAQRSIRYLPSISGHVLADLNLALRQMRYVAYQSDIDYIEAGVTNEEKQRRFQAFWDKLDPSPTTERNEAFEEYFARIAFANRNFKSYTDGWLTDKGMVYIVYGSPSNSERYSSYGDGRIYEKWIYTRNQREFIFADNTGFGDFRLVRPYSVTERYKYEN